MLAVLPGVALTLASCLRPLKALMSDDLPTFERPASAICGWSRNTDASSWALV
jgi:hypothetical protein